MVDIFVNDTDLSQHYNSLVSHAGYGFVKTTKGGLVPVINACYDDCTGVHNAWVTSFSLLHVRNTCSHPVAIALEGVVHRMGCTCLDLPTTIDALIPPEVSDWSLNGCALCNIPAPLLQEHDTGMLDESRLCETYVAPYTKDVVFVRRGFFDIFCSTQPDFSDPGDFHQTAAMQYGCHAIYRRNVENVIAILEDYASRNLLDVSKLQFRLYPEQLHGEVSFEVQFRFHAIIEREPLAILHIEDDIESGTGLFSNIHIGKLDRNQKKE